MPAHNEGLGPPLAGRRGGVQCVVVCRRACRRLLTDGVARVSPQTWVNVAKSPGAVCAVLRCQHSQLPFFREATRRTVTASRVFFAVTISS